VTPPSRIEPPWQMDERQPSKWPGPESLRELY
jgi:hypothetical protein